MTLDFPTDWLPRKTILILVFPVNVLTEWFIIGCATVYNLRLNCPYLVLKLKNFVNYIYKLSDK